MTKIFCFLKRKRKTFSLSFGSGGGVDVPLAIEERVGVSTASEGAGLSTPGPWGLNIANNV